MTTIIYENVELSYPEEMPQDEALVYVNEELNLNPTKKLTNMEISFSEDKSEVILKPHYDTITRVRRITGYLSSIPRFNDAKKAEEHDRVQHFQ